MGEKLSIFERFLKKCENFGYHLAGGEGDVDDNKKKNRSSREPSTKLEYTFLGSFPQTIKDDSVCVGAPLGNGLYRGDDGELYYHVDWGTGLINKWQKLGRDQGKFAYADHAPAKIDFVRYSNGANPKHINSAYFKVEPIKWRVINRENGVLTLLCDNALFSSKYKQDHSTDSWRSSDIRELLNNQFYNTAFNFDERQKILSSYIAQDTHNAKLLTKLVPMGTNDKIALISRIEIDKFGLKKVDLKKLQTDYLNPCLKIESGHGYLYCTWMTRSPSRYYSDHENGRYYVSQIYGDGVYEEEERRWPHYDEVGVVPVIRVNESDVVVFSDESNNYDTSASQQNNSNDAVMDNAEEATSILSDTSSEKQQNNAGLTLRRRILYTLIAPACYIVGLFVGMFFVGGASTGQIGGIITFAYLVFSEVMVWKLKNKSLTLFIVVLNIAVAFVCWIIHNL